MSAWEGIPFSFEVPKSVNVIVHCWHFLFIVHGLFRGLGSTVVGSCGIPISFIFTRQFACL